MTRTSLLLLLPLLGCSSQNEEESRPKPELTTVVELDAASYELAEGLTIKDGHAFVGLAPTGTILEIAPDGTRTDAAHVPAGGNDGYTLGLAFGANDDLFVLESKNSDAPTAPVPGVYRVEKNGGQSSTPFATHPDFGFPNGSVFDAHGNLLVMDSAAGRVFTVDASGAVTTWKDDPELAGTPDCALPLPFPIGANGIALDDTVAYVANTANGSLLAIDVNSDGTAGELHVVVRDCALGGIDGIALDRDGSVVAAINGSPGRIVRISPSGNVTTLASTAPLDGPASIAFADDWNGARVALVTSSAFFSVGVDGANPKPGLLALGPMP
jgi:sugar lactone lactonase YvrE